MLSDFFPILLFFILFKIKGIYAATAGLMSIMSAQALWEKHQKGHISKKNKMLLLSVLVLGGATLAFHDQRFIMWKPTIIFAIFSLALFINQIKKGKPVIQNLLEENIQLPAEAWQTLNIAWCLFFGAMAIINAYVIQHYDVDTWVNFKLFGLLGLSLLFTIGQGVYITLQLRKTS